MFHFHRLKSSGRLPHVPVFLESPTAVDASDIFCRMARGLKSCICNVSRRAVWRIEEDQRRHFARRD